MSLPVRPACRCRPALAVLFWTVFLLSGGMGSGRVCAGTPAFLLGEDAPVGGLVLCVNRTSRVPYAGGMGQQERKALFEVNLSMVNPSPGAIKIEPPRDAVLVGKKEYPCWHRRERDAMDAEFTLHSGLQTHGSIWFLIDADEPEAPLPVFRFAKGGERIEIILDAEVAAWRKRSAGELERGQVLQLVRIYLRGERLGEARNLLDRRLVSNPHDPALLLLRAEVAHRQGDREMMGRYLARIGDVSALSPDEIRQMGQLAFELDQLQLCIRALSAMPAGQLGVADRILLGKAHYYERNLDAAERLLLEAALSPNCTADGTFTLANVYDKRADLANAARWWQRTIELDARHVLAHFNLAVVAYREGRMTEAKTLWRRVLELDPEPDVKEMAEEALKNVR